MKDPEPPAPNPRSRAISTPWMIAGGSLILLAAVVSVSMIRNSSHQEDSATSPTGSSSTPDQVMASINCLGPQPWDANSGDVQAEYRCMGNVTSQSDQSFVYFFSSAGQETGWLTRVSGYNTGVPMVVGNGWAISTFHTDQIAAAINAGGRQVQ